MGDYNALSQDIMTTSIYNFLDNLLAAVRTSETLASEAQERDQINVSSSVKPGGYSEDIFIFLSEREKEEYICCVCYSVIKDAHQCSNGHKFCYSCIYVWSTCNRAGADCCPACRCDGIYARNEQVNEKIGGKRVKCQDDGCNWRGFLRDYNEHEHRHYEFKELSRSIELPSLKANDSPRVVTPQPLIFSDIPGVEKATVDSYETARHTGMHLGLAEHGPVSPSRTGVTRTNMAPRRLSRLVDVVAPSSRAFGSRTNTVSTRLPNFRTTVAHPPRPPRALRPSRASEPLGQLNQNESTQTYVSEAPGHASIEPAREMANLSARAASASREPRGALFPALVASTGGRHELGHERQRMEYRRLAPTYASRRNDLSSMNDGREQLAMMLILLTSDLEDRITVRTQSRDRASHVAPNAPYSSSSETILVTEDATSGRSRAAANRSSSRLQEFRNLNRRLSEVANSLDMLIESTSRQGGMATDPLAARSSDSSVSDNDSDTEE